MQRLLRLFLAVMVFSSQANAQCVAGYSQAQLNWDAMDFLKTTGGYATYVTTARSQTQKFAFASESVTITHNYTGSAIGGISTAHTGETGAFGTGADVQFSGNGTITLTFKTDVRNVKFSLFDIDVNQRVSFTAANSLGVAQTIGLGVLGGASTVLTVSNNNAINARVDASGSAVASTSVNGTVNVTVAGPVKVVTIVVTNTGTITSGPSSGQEPGAFWLSDVSACTSAAAFPVNYFATAKPFTNQPGYVLMSMNDQIYQVDPVTGKAKWIFTDPAGQNINSCAYDPYKKILYYTYSLTATPANDKKVMKYDFNNGTISTYIADVTTIGIPTYESGVESGSAAFFNGNLYLGIEGYSTGNSVSTGRKTTVWRIDIDSLTGNATSAIMAFGLASDNGANKIHDWGDIAVYNGVIYDFDGAVAQPNINQYNMFTGALTVYTPTFTANQTGVDYAGNIYNVGTSVSLYNGTTGAGTAKVIVGTPAFPASPSVGDATEAFKPKADFGDAPATYDPNVDAPAVHELVTTLRLGGAVTDEWTKNTSLLANGDADDGMPTPTILINNSNYLTNVVVFNNTGANATLAAWVDFNNNGTFEASEGITQTVPSSNSAQTIQLFWPNPSTTLAAYSYTFVRLRVTSTSNGMTAANPTGYYNNGEVEDYRVQVNAFLLPSELLAFNARKDGARARIEWSIADEQPGTGYILQRSPDGLRWEELQRSQATTAAQQRAYVAIDTRPFDEVSYYRLQVRKPGGQHLWSSIRELHWPVGSLFTIRPNPVYNDARVDVTSAAGGRAMLRIYTETGAMVLEQELKLTPGTSSHPFRLPAVVPAGTYLVLVEDDRQRQVQRLLLRR
ncbi:MAG: hypothetical protein EOO08_01360 [Chitinophagaceae bacterium]|nr:MAG: hypothetical protein EOO08_01360 [Chitinophagaceae bacterium]